MDAPTLFCPGCGAEYVAGTLRCFDCRLELVADPPHGGGPAGDAMGSDGMVELGDYARLEAQILRRRLETAGVSVLVEWTGPGPEATGTLVVSEEQADFAYAVVNEIDVDDEVPDTSPHAYVARIDEHLAAVSALLDELRTRLDELES